MITPHQLDLYSSNMASLYNSLEGEMLRIMADRLKKGKGILDWQARSMNDLHLFNVEVAKHLAKVSGVAQSEIERMFEETGYQLVKDIDSMLPVDPVPVSNALNNVMRGFYNQSWSEINNYVNQTLVSTNYGANSIASRAYTEVLNRSSSLFNTGIYTQNEAVEKAIRELAQKGIKSTFIDKGGHTWSMERYVRTVMKSTLSNTYDSVRKERMGDYGIHTVVVTSHMGARAACSRIQGQVVDLRPPSEIPAGSKYRSIYDPYWGAEYGTAGGHRGVNCRHNHIPFVPGVNTNNQPQFDKKENEKVAKARDRQRQLEREIVKFKKNKMVSEAMGNEEGIRNWNSYIRAKQKQMREHLAEHGEYLSRDYSREKVYTPLDTLLKDFNYKSS